MLEGLNGFPCEPGPPVPLFRSWQSCLSPCLVRIVAEATGLWSGWNERDNSALPCRSKRRRSVVEVPAMRTPLGSQTR